MKIARLVEVNYADFTAAMKKARAAGGFVTPETKPEWKAAVAERGVKAEAFKLMASERYGAEEIAILNGAEPWDGLFAWNPESHVCVRFAVSDG
ncbi:MAG: hypothetical protein AAFR11_07395 [Pseudomonadota bacterium]